MEYTYEDGLTDQDIASFDQPEEDNEYAPYPDEDAALARFDECLDEIHPPVTMGYLTWDASRVLKEMDPVAYRQDFLDWLNNESED